MEGKKNLCAMIPAELHARIMAEKEEVHWRNMWSASSQNTLKEETICRQNAPLR